MICSQCKKEFTPTGRYQKYCTKKCSNIIRKEYLKEYRKKYVQTDKGKEKQKIWKLSEEGKNYYKKYAQKYRQSNKGKSVLRKAENKYAKSDHGSKARIKYRKSEDFRNINNKWASKKYESDPIYKISVLVRRRLKVFLKAKNMRKTNKTFAITGCTPEFLKEYLEKQFKPGMTWKNHALKGWHIDHIIPLASAKTIEEVEKLSHYTNLQPMWATENIKKGDKY